MVIGTRGDRISPYPGYCAVSKSIDPVQTQVCKVFSCLILERKQRSDTCVLQPLPSAIGLISFDFSGVFSLPLFRRYWLLLLCQCRDKVV